MKFVEGAPVFAVEVRSDEEYGPAAEKRADYFTAGSLVVWDVDLLGPETVRSYRAGEAKPLVFRRGGVAHAEPALPGSSRRRPPGYWIS
jgi:Uma2 family endonuclease